MHFQRAQRGRPTLGRRVRARPHLRGKRQQPGPAVGAFEGATPRRHEIGQFGGNVLRHQVPIERHVNRPRHRQPREQPPQPRQHPVRVHGRVPIVAAVEGGMQFTGAAHIRQTVGQVLVGMGPFAADAGAAQAGILQGSRARETGQGRFHGQSRVAGGVTDFNAP